MVTLGRYDDQQLYDEGEELPLLAPVALEFHTKTLLPFYGDGVCLDVYGDMHVLRAAFLCRPRIKCLNLFTQHRGLDFGCLQLSDEDVTSVKDLLAGVSTLAFLIPSRDLGKVIHGSPGDESLQLLQSATNVKDLSIRGNRQFWHKKEFEYAIRKAHFPYLRSLTLERVTFDSKDLVTLVQGHITTLDRLELDHVTIAGDSWYNLFTAIRGGLKSLVGMYPKPRHECHHFPENGYANCESMVSSLSVAR